MVGEGVDLIVNLSTGKQAESSRNDSFDDARTDFSFPASDWAEAGRARVALSPVIGSTFTERPASSLAFQDTGKALRPAHHMGAPCVSCRQGCRMRILSAAEGYAQVDALTRGVRLPLRAVGDMQLRLLAGGIKEAWKKVKEGQPHGSAVADEPSLNAFTETELNHLRRTDAVWRTLVSRVSPAYDIVASWLYHRKESMALRFRNTRNPQIVGFARFVRAAELCGVPERAVLKAVRATVENAADTWRDLLKELPIPGEMATSLIERAHSMALTKDAGASFLRREDMPNAI